MTTQTLHATRPGYSERKDDHLSRLRKIEGQVRGLGRMVEDDRYCIDVITQIGAATHALQEVALGLLDDHARHCLAHAAAAGPDEAEEKFDELNAALRRTLRL
jgi:DNA-binding FrmR family transcriptional regulator